MLLNNAIGYGCYSNDPQEALNQTITLNLQFTRPLSNKEVEKATKSAEKAWLARNDEEANQIAQVVFMILLGRNYFILILYASLLFMKKMNILIWNNYTVNFYLNQQMS
jgi:hypothetical protein